MTDNFVNLVFFLLIPLLSLVISLSIFTEPVTQMLVTILVTHISWVVVKIIDDNNN